MNDGPYERDDPKHPDFAERAYDTYDFQRKYRMENDLCRNCGVSLDDDNWSRPGWDCNSCYSRRGS